MPQSLNPEFCLSLGPDSPSARPPGREMQTALEAPQPQGGWGRVRGLPPPASPTPPPVHSSPRPGSLVLNLLTEGRKIFAQREDQPSTTSWGFLYLSPPCIFLPGLGPFLLSCEALGGRSLRAQKEP